MYIRMLGLVWAAMVCASYAHAQPASCNNDAQCDADYFCESAVHFCQKCIHCEDLKREPPAFVSPISCIKSVVDCGSCLQGLMVNHRGDVNGECVPPDESTSERSLPVYIWFIIAVGVLGILIAIVMIVVLRRKDFFRIWIVLTTRYPLLIWNEFITFLTLMEYSLQILLSLTLQDPRQFMKLYIDLANIPALKSLNIERKVPLSGLILAIVISFRFFYVLRDCHEILGSCDISETFAILLFSWPSIARSVGCLSTILVLELVWRYIKEMRKHVVESTSGSNRKERIKQTVLMYKCLLDVTERVKFTMKMTLLVNVLFFIPRFFMYLTTALIQKPDQTTRFGTLLYEAVQVNLSSLLGTLIDIEIAKLKQFIEKQTICFQTTATWLRSSCTSTNINASAPDPPPPYNPYSPVRPDSPFALPDVVYTPTNEQDSSHPFIKRVPPSHPQTAREAAGSQNARVYNPPAYVRVDPQSPVSPLREEDGDNWPSIHNEDTTPHEWTPNTSTNDANGNTTESEAAAVSETTASEARVSDLPALLAAARDTTLVAPPAKKLRTQDNNNNGNRGASSSEGEGPAGTGLSHAPDQPSIYFNIVQINNTKL